MLAQIIDGLVFRAQRHGIERYLSENDLSSGKTLDLGCGYGWYAQLFSGDYIGVDNDEKRIAVACKKFPGKRFVEMSADKLDFPDGNFDLVIGFLVLHHLTDEHLGKALLEVQRVLRPGGKFLVIDLVMPEKFPTLARPLMWLDGAERRSHQQLAGFIERAGLKINGQYNKNYGIFSGSFFATIKQ